MYDYYGKFKEYLSKLDRRKTVPIICLFFAILFCAAFLYLFMNFSKTCIITFKDFDGTILERQTVTRGAIPVFNGSVYRKSDESYDYEFFSWDKPIEPATKSTTYKAVYTSLSKSKKKSKDTLNKSDSDKEDEEDAEEVISYEEYQKRQSELNDDDYDTDDNDDYEDPNDPDNKKTDKDDKTSKTDKDKDTDSDKSKDKDLSKSERDREKLNTYYTISFLDDDGTLLQSVLTKHGDIPSFSGVVRNKNQNGYKYSFIGWTPTISPAAYDKKYVAIYSRKKIDDGAPDIEEETRRDYIERYSEIIYLNSQTGHSEKLRVKPYDKLLVDSNGFQFKSGVSVIGVEAPGPFETFSLSGTKYEPNVTNDLTIFNGFIYDEETKTFIADYSKICTVDFVFNEFAPSDIIAPPQTTVVSGNSIEIPTPDPKPNGDYSFYGWYTDPSCSNEYRFDFSSKIYNDMTLYGRYSKYSNGSFLTEIRYINDKGEKDSVFVPETEKIKIDFGRFAASYDNMPQKKIGLDGMLYFDISIGNYLPVPATNYFFEGFEFDTETLTFNAVYSAKVTIKSSDSSKGLVSYVDDDTYSREISFYSRVGTEVTIYAIPCDFSGYQFYCWSDSSDNYLTKTYEQEKTIIVNNSTTYVADFNERIPRKGDILDIVFDESSPINGKYLLLSTQYHDQTLKIKALNTVIYNDLHTYLGNVSSNTYGLDSDSALDYDDGELPTTKKGMRGLQYQNSEIDTALVSLYDGLSETASAALYNKTYTLKNYKIYFPSNKDRFEELISEDGYYAAFVSDDYFNEEKTKTFKSGDCVLVENTDFGIYNYDRHIAEICIADIVEYMGAKNNIISYSDLEKEFNFAKNIWLQDSCFTDDRISWMLYVRPYALGIKNTDKKNAKYYSQYVLEFDILKVSFTYANDSVSK